MTRKALKCWLGCTALAVATLGLTNSAFAQGCGGQITPQTLPVNTTFAVGQNAALEVQFGPTGNGATINSLVVNLECHDASGCFTTCDSGTALTYLGDVTISGNTCGVTITSNNVGGGSTGSVTFTFTPAISLAANATCKFQFGVNINSLSDDNTTKQITGTAQYFGTCNNGLPLSQCGSYILDVVAPSIQIVKSVNDDEVCQGEPVTYAYVVTNTGNAELENVEVVDDNGTPGNTADDFNPTFVGPDVGNDGILSPGEVWAYTHGPVVLPVGTTTNTAEVTGDFVNSVGTVTVDDDDDATVVVNPPPSCSIDDTPLECAVQLCVDTNACGPFTVVWSGPGGFTSTSTCITLDATDLAGDYCVRVTDCNGCQSGGPGSSCCYTFTPPVIDISCNGAVACDGGSGNLCATVSGNNGPFTVQWFNPSNQLIETCSNLTSGQQCCVSVSAEGNYTAVVSDTAGCTDECVATFDLLGNRLVQVSDASACEGSPNPQMCATISGGVAPYTVTWRDAGNNVVQVCNNVAEGGQCCFTSSQTAPGDYTYTITAVDSSSVPGGCQGQGTATLTIHTVPTCSITPPACLCPGETTTLSTCPTGGTAPYTVVWRDPANQIIKVCNNVQAGQCCTTDPVSAAGVYSATVTDANNCESDPCTASVTACPVPSCSISVSACPFPRTLTVTPSNCTGCTFQWGTGGAANCVPLAGETNNTLVVNAPGTYCVTLTSSDGCVGSCEVLVEVCSGQGRTPGFWKQEHHFGHWPAPYCASDDCPCGPATLFCDVFDCTSSGNCQSGVNNAYANKTLLEVLGQGGGGFYALGRHAVAALLNSAHNAVDYIYTTQQVIDMTNQAIDSCNPNPTKSLFAEQNELGGGPLGGQLFCENLVAGYGSTWPDFDGDGVVNGSDMSILLSHWGPYSGPCDLHQNNKINNKDVLIMVYLLELYGQ